MQQLRAEKPGCTGEEKVLAGKALRWEFIGGSPPAAILHGGGYIRVRI